MFIFVSPTSIENLFNTDTLINVLLAEDHNIVRNGIRSLLDTEHGVQVVGEATTGTEALQIITSGVHADVVLADINMPEMSGIQLVKALRSTPSNPKVLILSMLDHENYIIEAVNAGASGYLLKNVSKEELLFAIAHVAGGDKYICSELVFKMFFKHSSDSHCQLDEKTVNSISKREIEVLTLIAEGYTNMEIADMLFTSRRTVEGHRQNLIDKTGVKNTAALIKLAVKNGLIY